MQRCFGHLEVVALLRRAAASRARGARGHREASRGGAFCVTPVRGPRTAAAALSRRRSELAARTVPQLKISLQLPRGLLAEAAADPLRAAFPSRQGPPPGAVVFMQRSFFLLWRASVRRCSTSPRASGTHRPHRPRPPPLHPRGRGLRWKPKHMRPTVSFSLSPSLLAL